MPVLPLGFWGSVIPLWFSVKQGTSARIVGWDMEVGSAGVYARQALRSMGLWAGSYLVFKVQVWSLVEQWASARL